MDLLTAQVSQLSSHFRDSVALCDMNAALMRSTTDVVHVSNVQQRFISSLSFSICTIILLSLCLFLPFSSLLKKILSLLQLLLDSLLLFTLDATELRCFVERLDFNNFETQSSQSLLSRTSRDPGRDLNRNTCCLSPGLKSCFPLGGNIIFCTWSRRQSH